MIENSDSDQIERLNSRIIELLRERDALVKALKGLLNDHDRLYVDRVTEARATLASIKRTS